ncbi:MAG TPA: permease-like cell division protein FtsX [Pseudonocardiaceae bacterium]|jgi:cell division transport system permease protein|nr:permease-like cell division protein FtsX [Pseudonocardiaceae bacterium]
MRASFVFSEVINGLRRNVTMTVAMILTTAISLGLLGGGLLIVRTIDKMQNIFLNQLQVAVNLTDDVSANDTNCAQALCQSLRAQLESTPGVKDVQFVSRNAAYQQFRAEFADMPELQALGRPQALPASLRVDLNDQSLSGAIVKEFTGRPGVKNVNDQGVFVQRLTDALNGARNLTFVIALIAALAALLLISITVQVSAFTRRTEVGIMRLVGATRWYTQLPFLLEAVVAGIVGAVLATGGLLLAKTAFLDKAFASLFQSGIIPRIELGDVLLFAAPWLLLTAIVVSALTGYLTLRMYVRL